MEIIVSLYVLLFVYAAMSKLLDFQKFVVQLGQSPMLTEMARYVAWVVPGVELFISFLLLLPKTRIGALYASFSLMTLFTVYIVLASRFSDYVPCSCGGVIQQLSWGQHLIFNLVFLALGVSAILLSTTPEMRDRVIT